MLKYVFIGAISSMASVVNLVSVATILSKSVTLFEKAGKKTKNAPMETTGMMYHHIICIIRSTRGYFGSHFEYTLKNVHGKSRFQILSSILGT